MSEPEQIQAMTEQVKSPDSKKKATDYMDDILDASAKLDGIISCLGQVNTDGGAVLSFERLSMAMSEYIDRIEKMTTALWKHLRAKGFLNQDKL